jgi:hypothetical protein
LYNNTLQLQLSNSGKLEYFCNGVVTNPLSEITVVQRQYIKSTVIQSMNVDILSFIRTMILQGYYYTSSVNEFYIKNRNTYQRENFDHGIMVYGIDDENEKLYVAGYTSNKKFETQVIDFDEFSKAFYSLSKESGCNCFKYNSKQIDIDLVKIKNLLIDYIFSRDSSYIFGNSAFITKNVVYGIEACKSYLNDVGTISIKNFHIMYEYSVLMQERLKYLNEKYYDINLDLFIFRYYEIIQIKRCNMLKALKMSMSNKTIVTMEQIKRTNEVLEEERNLLIGVINILNKKCNHDNIKIL